MPTLKQQYTNQIVPELQKELGLKTVFAVPRLSKFVINVSIGHPQEARQRMQIIENVVTQIEQISGQKPQVTKARKSIAAFKLRQGDPLGLMVTLRGKRMWQFLEKLIGVALPRVKDFRGVPLSAFDGHGNYSLGIEEQIIFPEINYDQIESVRGFQIVMVTTAKNDQEGLALLKKLGLPFEKEEQ